MIAGFFAVDFAINGLFIARAVGTFPGEDVKNSYVQGNDYNAALAQRAQQLQLGWTAEAGLDGGGNVRTFVLRLSRADGKPVSGMGAKLKWRWIGRDVDERAIDLREQAPGEYAAALSAAGTGRIAAAVEVRKPGAADIAFSASKTLVIE
jgi:nitrogen fixation protein FixH